MTVANFFTLLRIALIPLFGVLWARGRYGEALWAFGIAAVSDLLDGFLARMLDQRTRLGAMLDPLADKLMLLVAFLVAASLGAVPWWLAGIVIGRDALVSGGTAIVALALRGRFEASRFQPTRIGKYSTVLQVVTIGLALATRALHAQAPRPWVAALVVATALFTVVSGVQYVGRAMPMLVGPGPRGAPGPADAPSGSGGGGGRS